MPSLSHFSAVIFDMDGLVLDTEPSYFMAWRQAAKTMGYELSEAFCLSLSGLHYPEIEQRLLDLFGAGFNLQTLKHIAAEHWRDHVNTHGIKVKQGFNELLEFIIQQQIPYCLATNSRAVNAYECLELAGIANVFSTVITRDDVDNGKPEPDIFLMAANRLQVDIGRCLIFEDSHTGIVAASRAGACSVFIPSVLPANAVTVELADWLMDDLMQALEIIRTHRTKSLFANDV